MVSVQRSRSGSRNSLYVSEHAFLRPRYPVLIPLGHRKKRKRMTKESLTPTTGSSRPVRCTSAKRRRTRATLRMSIHGISIFSVLSDRR